jgi:heptose-I-phosphate ethanolaminephosphotransferase
MKTLLSLYPPFLLLMVLYVQFAAAIVNIEIYSFRELLIMACWIPVFTIPGLFIRKRWYKVFFVLLFFLGGLANLIHLLILKGPLSASSIFILLNTNVGEASDFLALKWSYLWLLVIPYMYLFYVALKKKSVNTSVNKYLVIILVILMSVFFGEAILHDRFVRKALPQTSKALISFIQEIQTYKNLKLRELKKVEATSNYSGEQIIVLILGESCNRSHMSIYGYHQETNPNLKLRNDMVVYKDVVSPYSNTIGSVLSMMTETNRENRLNYDKAISLIDVFHSVGYRTYWLSNQLPIGIWDNAIFNLARSSDRIVFTNNYANTSFESTNLSPYDEELLQPLSRALISEAGSKFIVIHLMGSHAAYSKRYPSGFNKFITHSNSKKKLINEYDNSMLYNDFVVDSIFEILKSHSQTPNSRISAIYIADHGENVYDENETVGHDYAGSLPQTNVAVPMFVWNSDTTTLKALKANVDLPFMSDDLFHAIIDMSAIISPHFIPEKSIFNKNYDSSRKRILEDGIDYDKKNAD